MDETPNQNMPTADCLPIKADFRCIFDESHVQISVPSWKKYGSLVDNEDFYPIISSLLTDIRTAYLTMITTSASEFYPLLYDLPDNWIEDTMHMTRNEIDLWEMEQNHGDYAMIGFSQSHEWVGTGRLCLVTENIKDLDLDILAHAAYKSILKECCSEIIIFAVDESDTCTGVVGSNQFSFSSYCGSLNSYARDCEGWPSSAGWKIGSQFIFTDGSIVNLSSSEDYS